MNLQRVEGPTEADVLSLVTVAEIKANLRIAHTQEDTRIQRAIVAAYAFFDGRYGWLNRAILTQSWRLSLPGFMVPVQAQDDDARPVIEWQEADRINLPLPSLRSVDEITYLNTDNVRTTLHAPAASLPTVSTILAVNTSGLFGCLRLLDGQSWPDTYTDDEAVQITFTAGWGSAADIRNDPSLMGVRRAIELVAGDIYQNPAETFVEPRMIQVNRRIENGYRAAAGRYRIPNTLVP